MDKELDDFFEGYDLSGEQDESTYRRQSHKVSEQFEKKLSRAGSNLRFVQDLLVLFRYFVDEDVAWQKKVIVVAALLYFISPLDSIPDIAPFVGYLDDLGVVLAVTRFMSKELEPYYPVDTPRESVAQA